MTIFRRNILISLIVVFAAAVGAVIALFSNALTASADTNYNKYTYNGTMWYEGGIIDVIEDYVDRGSYG